MYFIYLFGDNLLRKGLGGQAKEMRGEPNTLGIVSKKYPSNSLSSFYSDGDFYSWLQVFFVGHKKFSRECKQWKIQSNCNTTNRSWTCRFTKQSSKNLELFKINIR